MSVDRFSVAAYDRRMTTMTIIDDLLVLLDDELPRDLETMHDAIRDRSKQTLSSTLARLLAKGWVERVAGRGRRRYRISTFGRRRVTELLDHIKHSATREWDGSWELVVFNIPERERKRRDTLRKLLVELGYGRLHNSLWLSPWSNRTLIQPFLEKAASDADVTLVQTGRLAPALSRRIAERFEWDWEALDRAYRHFIDEARVFLRQRSKDAYTARRIVFHYSKILQTDPKLPVNLPSRVERSRDALALYDKLRPYCYQE
jgi:phenylacetic acid degradation operon negative regulatory protein